jgi:hypothetical protein
VSASKQFFNILAPGVIQDQRTGSLSWPWSEHNALNLAYIHAFLSTANVHWQEDPVAISLTHGFK